MVIRAIIMINILLYVYIVRYVDVLVAPDVFFPPPVDVFLAGGFVFSLNRFLNFLLINLRYDILPVPLVLLLNAFSLQLYRLILAAGYPHDAHRPRWI